MNGVFCLRTLGSFTHLGFRVWSVMPCNRIKQCNDVRIVMNKTLCSRLLARVVCAQLYLVISGSVIKEKFISQNEIKFFTSNSESKA